MRKLVLFAISVLSFAFLSCNPESGDFNAETIIGLERAALDRWGRGDPQGFFDLSAPDQTYFNPTGEKRVDGGLRCAEPRPAESHQLDGLLDYRFQLVDVHLRAFKSSHEHFQSGNGRAVCVCLLPGQFLVPALSLG